MQVDPLTIFAVGGVASLLIERIFYYRLKYKKKPDKWQPIPEEPDNPGYGERIAKLEEGMENMKDNNEKDHRLIRQDIKKIFNLIDGMRK